MLHSLHVEEKEVWGHQLVVHLLVYLAVFFADHSFVTALLKLDLETYGSVFRKWITKNIDQVSRFHKAVVYVLNNDKCKSKFVEAIGQSFLENTDSFDEEKENILDDIDQ